MDKQIYPVNLVELKNISKGDTEFERELITIFLKQIPEFISNMNLFLEEARTEELSREAHTAKSSVLIFGMINTGNLLKEIEIHARQNNTTAIKSILKKAEKEMNHAATYLQTLLTDYKFIE